MKTRRGSLLWGRMQGAAILMYKPGDVVKPVVVMDQFFTGVVRDVDLKTNKILVSWGGGPVSQHDPDEIMPIPFFGAALKNSNVEASGGVLAPSSKDRYSSVKWLGSVPETCDICNNRLKDWFVDGNTRSGAWGNMCPKCFTRHGIGLGLGKGQKWDVKSGRKLEGSDRIASVDMGALALDGLKSRRATGEMGSYDIRPGGEHYEWAKMIEKAAREIQRLSKNRVRFVEMRPFDTYQGPYAKMSSGKLWSGEGHNEFSYDVGPGRKFLQGTPGEIALELLIGFGEKKVASGNLKSRKAMYWCAPDRTFRLTKREQEEGTAMCPQCKCNMTKERFTRLDKLLTCPECGFKVPTSKAVTNIEVKVPEGVNVGVTTTGENGEEIKGENVMASMVTRRGRFAYADPTNLADISRMSLRQIAALVRKDWKNVNYAAKPYLDAMGTLQNVTDMYAMDSGSSIVSYFLSNASSWRGDVAKAVKVELKRRIK